MHKCFTDTVQLPECHRGFSTYLSQYLQPGWVTISIRNVCQCCRLQQTHQHKCRALSLAAVYKWYTCASYRLSASDHIAPLGDVTCLNCLRRTLAVKEPRCRTMCTSRGVSAADTGTRMAQTVGCSLTNPGTWLIQLTCLLSRLHGRRELWTHLELDRSDPQDGTPRIRSCPACQTRLQTSQRVEIRHHPRRRRGVRSPGPLSRLSRTGRALTDGRTPRRRPPATTYVIERGPPFGWRLSGAAARR